MKKLYTLLVLLFAFSSANSQIVNIPDANFKAKLLQANSSEQIASSQTPVYNPGNGNWSVNTYNTIDTNGDGEIQVTEAQSIKWLNVFGNNITDLTGIAEFVNLRTLYCYFNQLTSLNVSGLTNLLFLDCQQNQLTSIDVSSNTSLQFFKCNGNQSTSINVSGLTNLQHLYCEENQLTNLNVSGLTNLKSLFCFSNQLTSLNVSGLTNLQSLYCYYNQITSLNVLGLTNLMNLSCGNNQLTSLDISSLTNLQNFYCSNNQLTTLSISNNSLVDELDCSNNQLTTLFIKNNYIYNWSILNFQNNPNLLYICADEQDFSYVQNKINIAGYSSTCHVNNYCSFAPGGIYYFIQGNTKLDSNINGCDINDLSIFFQKYSITSGANSGFVIANQTGNYSIPVSAGTHTIAPIFENQSYFTVSPTSASASFPSTASPSTKNFCVTANGIHNDVEVFVIPIGAARPGFDATYRIVYKNKGNQIATGTLNFSFDDTVMDIISATPLNTSADSNNLSWNYTNLNPFETREIDLVFNINSPMETPAVNGGDILSYTTTIIGATDETPNDNIFTLNQTVVNSYDPNDKTCIEGTSITPSMVGQYVHYVIRFENTGTFPAENIVVKDMIDTTKFDITTLIPQSGSHSFVTRVINTNQVEFIFENINLPFDDANNDGYVAFKIKTKPTLVVGNTFSNGANIYFDYNFPITTNTYVTTVQALGNQDFEFDSMFSLSPVPTKDLLTITAKESVVMTSVNIYNILGQLVQVNTNPTDTIDVSGLSSGSYFIKIISDRGSSTGKFIKE